MLDGHKLLVAGVVTSSYILGYWIPNLIIYYLWTSHYLEDAKFQKNKTPPKELINTVLQENILHTIFLQPFFGYVLVSPFFSQSDLEMPTFLQLVFQLFVSFLFADGSFYWLHRLVHHRLLYKRIHKKHHEFKVSVGLASNYAGVVEELFVNLVSTIMGPLILHYFFQMHLFSFWLYMILRLEESVEEHCGFHLKYSPWNLLRHSQHHDYHHR